MWFNNEESCWAYRRFGEYILFKVWCFFIPFDTFKIIKYKTSVVVVMQIHLGSLLIRIWTTVSHQLFEKSMTLVILEWLLLGVRLENAHSLFVDVRFLKDLKYRWFRYKKHQTEKIHIFINFLLGFSIFNWVIVVYLS